MVFTIWMSVLIFSIDGLKFSQYTLLEAVFHIFYEKIDRQCFPFYYYQLKQNEIEIQTMKEAMVNENEDSKVAVSQETHVQDQNSYYICGKKKKNREQIEEKREEQDQYVADSEEIIPKYHKIDLIDTNQIRKLFYTIDPTTCIMDEQIQIDVLTSFPLKIGKDSEGAQILVYHTHSQEAFLDSEPGNQNTSIVGAGEYLASILHEQYGYNVIHHCGQYDVESRDHAYSKAAPAVEQLLRDNPTIQVVIDLHRDAIADDTKLVTTINGKQTAQIMFFNGLSYTNSRGAIAYLKNDNLEENLAFSFQMKAMCDSIYPNFARKNYLKGYRYNMQYRGKTLLIEMGAQNNTVEEIYNACEPLAKVLYFVLSGESGIAE